MKCSIAGGLLAVCAVAGASAMGGFSCTQGTTPDCDEGVCGPGPLEAAAPVEAGPLEAAPVEAAPAD
jgi:hypothetical protein